MGPCQEQPLWSTTAPQNCPAATSAQSKGQSSHWQSQVLKSSSLGFPDYSCSTAKSITHRANQFSWCENTQENLLPQPAKPHGCLQILSHPAHANQADGVASHCPFSPPSPLSPYVPFAVLILEQQRELSLFGWRGGQGRVGDIISSEISVSPWSRCKMLQPSAGPHLLLKKLFSACLVKLEFGEELRAGSEWARMHPGHDVSAVVWKVGFSSKLLQSGDVSNERVSKWTKPNFLNFANLS